MEVKATLTSPLGRIVLGNEILTIGRAVDSGLVISDPKVSRHHAEIRPDEQGYAIVDLGSANGTFVNGERLTPNIPRLLHSGDIIRIAGIDFTYEEEYPTSQQNQTATWSPSPAGAPPLFQGTADEDIYPSARPLPSGEAPPQSTGALGEVPAYEEWIDNTNASFPASQKSPSPSMPNIPPPGTVFRYRDDSIAQPVSPVLPESKGPSQEYLQFAAFHPRTVPVETWNTLLVYAYIEPALQAVRDDAYQFKAQLGPDPFRAEAWALHPLPRGTLITVVPAFQGVVFSPERLAFTWEKDWHRVVFSFGADRSWVGKVSNGEITIFAGPLIIASLRLSLRFGEQGFQGSRDREEVFVSRYRKIFTSYSHMDTPIVSVIRNAYKAIGDDTFLDVENLRSGQYWNPALQQMIDNADVFQLFWSKNSAQSRYVYEECQYALQHYKYEGFIRPVYWEKPVEAPPVQLSHLHFAYYELPPMPIANNQVSPIPITNKKDSLLSRFFSIFRRIGS